ncbi:MAG: glutathione-disulfide reductase [Deltaproteobacteria bacterium]|nr:glutathione-disulfide reductase [Deltaproteobacteria bacterium]
MLRRYDVDLFTIGGGSGGIRASRLAAEAGAKVALAEAGRLGGTCVNLGCIPKKLMAYAASFPHEMETARSYGFEAADLRFDWPTLLRNRDHEITRLNGLYQQALERAGVHLIRGHARIIDPHTVEVDDQPITAEHILIATGGKPWKPTIEGAEFAITSDDAFHLPEPPKRILIVGGGYIAIEFASIFHGLGSEVSLLHRRPLLLRGFDHDVAKHLGEALRARGIDLLLERTVERIEKTPSGLQATLSDERVVIADAVLCAMGRTPNTKRLGIEALSVKRDGDDFIVVDSSYRTSVPSLYAIGDVIGKKALTPVALAEARAFVQAVFRQEPISVDYAQVPTAVFSSPPVATVGVTEHEARAEHLAFDVYESTFRPLKASLTPDPERTYMKLIVDRTNDRVLGCHMVGPNAPEIVQGFAVALRCGATKHDFDSTIGIHPTAAEEFVTMRSKRP